VGISKYLKNLIRDALAVTKDVTFFTKTRKGIKLVTSPVELSIVIMESGGWKAGQSGVGGVGSVQLVVFIVVAVGDQDILMEILMISRDGVVTPRVVMRVPVLQGPDRVSVEDSKCWIEFINLSSQFRG
jgi:hypothetical protein